MDEATTTTTTNAPAACCAGRRPDGSPCARTVALRPAPDGRDYCASHHPDGQRPRTGPGPLRTPKDARRWASYLAQAAVNGTLTASQVAEANRAVRTFIDAHKVAELQEQVKRYKREHARLMARLRAARRHGGDA